MDTFEKKMKKLLQRTQSYDMAEFFLERDSIMQTVDDMKKLIYQF